MPILPGLEAWVGTRVTDPGYPVRRLEERRVVLSKAKRLRLSIGVVFMALLVCLSGVAVTGCGSGATEEGKKEAKENAEKKETESKEKQQEKT